MVGLGPGLTPSGDDFMGALLFVARHLSAGDPAALSWEKEAVEQFLARARPLTGCISHAILSDMAHGEGPEPLHALVGRWVEGAPMDQVRSAADRLIRLGHTSGWDMLAGVLMGMQMKQPGAVSQRFGLGPVGQANACFHSE